MLIWTCNLNLWLFLVRLFVDKKTLCPHRQCYEWFYTAKSGERFNDHNLKQIVKEPTRTQGIAENILDLILTNNPDMCNPDMCNSFNPFQTGLFCWFFGTNESPHFNLSMKTMTKLTHLRKVTWLDDVTWRRVTLWSSNDRHLDLPRPVWIGLA